MSSRTRMMGAGNATSTNYKTNVNLNTGGGSKKQGITSRVGLDNWSNLAVQTYSNGYGRNKLFVMNQLGGVGAGKSMFNGRFTQVDGVHSAKNPSYFDPNKGIANAIKELVKLLKLYPPYVNPTDPYSLSAVGMKETFRSDLIDAGVPLSIADEAHVKIIHFETINDLPIDLPNRDRINYLVTFVNRELKIDLPPDTDGIDFGFKTCALVPQSTKIILNAAKFGLYRWNGLRVFDNGYTTADEAIDVMSVVALAL